MEKDSVGGQIVRDITLINLVSDQTLQNLIPILALKPARVVQVMSSDPRFPQIAGHLENALQKLAQVRSYMSLKPSFFRETIAERSPVISTVSSVLHGIVSKYPNCVLNFTGGTKLMSIGAWQAAQENHIPTVYCDTQQKRIISAGFSQQLDRIPDFTELFSTLPVEVVMAVNGVEGRLFSKKLTSRLRAFGKKAFELASESPDEMDSYKGQIIAHFLRGKRNMPQSTSALKSLVSTPLPSSNTNVVHEFLSSAVLAGLLVSSENGKQFYPACNADRSQLTHLQNLLTGGWYELYLADLLCSNPSRFPTVHWSVEPEKRRTAVGETDIVAIDSASTALHIISCKSTLYNIKPLEHIEAMAQRRLEIGGTFAKATVAVRCKPHRVMDDQVKKWGKLLKVNVLYDNEVSEHFC